GRVETEPTTQHEAVSPAEELPMPAPRVDLGGQAAEETFSPSVIRRRSSFGRRGLVALASGFVLAAGVGPYVLRSLASTREQRLAHAETPVSAEPSAAVANASPTKAGPAEEVPPPAAPLETVRLAVSPERASVTVDGEATPVRQGAVSIT